MTNLGKFRAIKPYVRSYYVKRRNAGGLMPLQLWFECKMCGRKMRGSIRSVEHFEARHPEVITLAVLAE